MIYLQDLHNGFSRLMADSERELRQYAKSQKIPMSWVQYPRTWHVHIDITGSVEQRIKKDASVKKVTSDALLQKEKP
jgi:hypothetical protein